MQTVAIPIFLPYVLVAVGAAGWLLCFQAWRHLAIERQKNAAVNKAYGELMKGSQKREDELRAERNRWAGRAAVAEADADRLAPVVAQYVKDVDETAALLKDDKPPTLAAEREALASHQNALIFRNDEIAIPAKVRPDEEAIRPRAIADDPAGRR